MRNLRPILGLLAGVMLPIGSVVGCDDPTSPATPPGGNGTAVRPAADATTRPTADAVDPNCHMTVRIGPDTPQAKANGRTYYFCSDDSREAFLRSQSRPGTPTDRR